MMCQAMGKSYRIKQCTDEQQRTRSECADALYLSHSGQIPNIQHEISRDVDDQLTCKSDESVIPWFCACDNACVITSYMRKSHGITS